MLMPAAEADYSKGEKICNCACCGEEMTRKPGKELLDSHGRVGGRVKNRPYCNFCLGMGDALPFNEAKGWTPGKRLKLGTTRL